MRLLHNRFRNQLPDRFSTFVTITWRSISKSVMLEYELERSICNVELETRYKDLIRWTTTEAKRQREKGSIYSATQINFDKLSSFFVIFFINNDYITY